MKLYRIEQNEKDGIFYTRNQEYKLADPGLTHIPMPYEPNIYKQIYSSSCSTIKDLLYWIPKIVQEILKSRGYKLVVYESNDYFEREHGEFCFNKTNYISRTELNWES